MARAFKPIMPFSVPMKLLIPSTGKAHGTTTKTFPDPADEKVPLIYGSFRTFGGTENMENGLYTVFDTATIDTWYRPDITSDCRLYICQTGETYEIKGTPENIDMRNQYMQIKVQKIGGKA